MKRGASPSYSTVVQISIVVLLVFLLYVFIVPRDQSEMSNRRYTSGSTARVNGISLGMYAEDNDDRLPPKSFTEAEWRAVSKAYGYGFSSGNPNGGEFMHNPNMGGMIYSKLQPGTVLVAETKDWPGGGRFFAVYPRNSAFLRRDESELWNPASPEKGSP